MKALSNGLRKNYEDVSVDEVECPDLTEAPYHLKSRGLSGSPAILEIGGDGHFFPTPNFSKVYDLIEISQKALPDVKTVFVTGAGMGLIKDEKQCEEVLIFQFL